VVGTRAAPHANCVGLLPVSDTNPTQFGHQRRRGAAGASTSATSLPSMLLFAPHNARRRMRTTRAGAKRARLKGSPA
jgi:hypothetical protein